ncbi:AAA family ATPase [Aestuariispira ectoiniformans]|uniref:AAA family ATPase n=1 Tax=Aestuariispira ectoiniformans TaxID=2775080 RepID=UPI00223A9465|nr:AAA family ATPase [Aestuariispira ectoiniformans]
MHFKKLRVSGFKSFADQTEMLIEPGLTGVVGPNGCGKSNVIESLRWVMGETSAKRMRGKDMDDVIFGGSSNRPARNLAEVSVVLDNSGRTGPIAFNDADELEITRRIERGQGSSYRINGRDVRARDVQLLFADLASGANSTAIVSQGRIGALIGAKPSERRTLLEEAAGIRGLHSRRHEAELRLKAAESNLERLEDVIGALETQNQGLQRQARQANRYRKLSEQIRRFEGILLHLRWEESRVALEEAGQRLGEIEEVVTDRTQLTASGAAAQTRASEALPELRKAEAAASAELQRLQLAERELTNEESRIQQTKLELENRLRQIAADLDREQSLSQDARAALERLLAEREELAGTDENQSDLVAELQEAVEIATEEVAEKETELQQLTESVAGLDAQRNSLTGQINQAEARIERLKLRAEELAAERESLTAEMEVVAELELAAEAVAEAEEILEEARATLEAAEESQAASDQAERAARDQLQQAEQQARQLTDTADAQARERLQHAEKAAREQVQQAESALATLTAEEKALTKLVEGAQAELKDPVTDSLQVEPGYEKALGAALGEDLDASVNETEPVHWAGLPPLSGMMGMPKEAEPLVKFVTAPSALNRRLAQIGVVADAETGRRLQGSLGPGQRLVSRDGGLWRWDGFTVAEGAPTAAAKRLEQMNRLVELRDQIVEAESQLAGIREAAEEQVETAKVEGETLLEEARLQAEALTESAQTAFADTVEAAQRANEATRQRREAQQQAYAKVNEARQAHSSLSSRAAAAQSRVASVEENAERTAQEIEETQAQLVMAQEALDGLEDPQQAWDRVNQLRAVLAELRTVQVEKRSAFDRLQRESESRRSRLSAIEVEEASWQERAAGAGERMEDLSMRAESAAEQKELLESRPEEIAEQRLGLLDAITEAEAKRNAVADKLSEAERFQMDVDRALKDAEHALAEAREMRVRRQAEVEQAQQNANNVAERIQEKLDCYPKDVLRVAGIEEGEELPPKAEVEVKVDRLTRERDNMGAVNLRAEQEAAELSDKITSMHTERDDLLAAIARLRQGIAALNREGRGRLLAAFEEVNNHFQELFVKLFGGGEAKLKLTEAEDPLQAGLEIMASPPGKRMQVMSLLSGGEQALTALSLLFAVFLTNPAPICVLDEVDAPLDDSNVDRFCMMLEEMAAAGTTRFLVVTHHRMTMARVDRLFGVTMAERGVSQLVSVDLRQAAAMRDAV